MIIFSPSIPLLLSPLFLLCSPLPRLSQPGFLNLVDSSSLTTRWLMDAMSVFQSTHMCSGRLVSSIGLLCLWVDCCLASMLAVAVVFLVGSVVVAVHLNVVRDTSARHMLADRSISRQWSKKGQNQYFLVAPLRRKGKGVVHMEGRWGKGRRWLPAWMSRCISSS